MSKLNNICKSLMIFLLILATIITCIDFCCFDHNFYHQQYNKLNNAESIGVSNDDLMLMTDDLLDYLQDKRDNLDLKVDVNGVNREVFNEREKLHMVDVKDLYEKVILVRNLAVVFGLCCLVVLILNNDFKGLFKAYRNNLLIYGFIFLFIGLFCLIDFDSFWYNFHTIFFTKNDYWLLDPNTSILINMVPGEFFFALCIRIVIIVLISLGLYGVAFKLISKKVDL